MLGQQHGVILLSARSCRTTRSADDRSRLSPFCGFQTRSSRSVLVDGATARAVWARRRAAEGLLGAEQAGGTPARRFVGFERVVTMASALIAPSAPAGLQHVEAADGQAALPGWGVRIPPATVGLRVAVVVAAAARDRAAAPRGDRPSA